MRVSRYHRGRGVAVVPVVTSVVTSVVVLGLAGCGSPQAPPLVVFAAASLTESFTTLTREFGDDQGIEVVLNVGASSALAQQIVSGAPADVFASASPVAMGVVEQAGRLEGPTSILARNRLMIAVPAGNPAGVSGLADFTDPDLVIALCAPQVPCGEAADHVFRIAGLEASPDTYEADVRATLSKVRLGEVDAALVYRTDVLAAEGQVEGIDVPEAAQVLNDYPVAVLSDSADPAAARAFVEFLGSERATQVLSDAGFDLP